MYPTPQLRIREWRKYRGLTQDTLAASVGIARQNLSNLERGRFQPKPETLGRIATALETRPHLLWAPPTAE